MSTRLTYSSNSEAPAWTRLVLPGMLLLSAVSLMRVTDPAPFPVTDEIALPLQTLMCLLLVGVSALLNQQTLPGKAAQGTKALAAAVGGPFVFVLLFPYFQTFSPADGAGFALMPAGWLFFLNGKNQSPVRMAASGLCGGLAVSLAPMTLSGLLPVACWNVIRISGAPKTQLMPGLLWLLAVTAGLVPLFLGTAPVPVPYFGSFAPDPLLQLPGQVLKALPAAVYPFLLLGLLIAGLQKQPVVLGLFFSAFLIRLLLSGFRLPEENPVDPGLLLPVIWTSAYGILRVLRGMEQGIRNLNSAKAKRFPATATLFCFFAFGAWMISRYLLT